MALILALGFGRVTSNRIVIVGGGFGGLHLVRALERRLRPGEADVTLLDRNNYHLFTPLLYQVATGELPPHAVAYPLRQTIVREAKYRFVQTNVERIDLEAHAVDTADGRIPYDRLVLAAGSVTNDYGIPGVREHALGMKYLAEAQEVRRRILTSFERADVLPDPEGRRRLLTFIVIGAGPVGVELSASMRDLFDHSLRGSYANIDIDRDPSITLLDAGERVLATMDERLGRVAARRLEELRVDVRLRTPVSEVVDGAVRTKTGPELRASTIVWAGGVRDLARSAAGERTSGRGRHLPRGRAGRSPRHRRRRVRGMAGQTAGAAGAGRRSRGASARGESRPPHPRRADRTIRAQGQGRPRRARTHIGRSPAASLSVPDDAQGCRLCRLSCLDRLARELPDPAPRGAKPRKPADRVAPLLFHDTYGVEHSLA
ncbi:MAG: hypothetical protein E6I87_00255 [Chloroflexi bacterium]|nr:MAG: hypothetical protein E6I87_00255 [Chloroflexota bacterium]